MFKFATILILKITDQSTHSLQSLPKNNRPIKSHVGIRPGIDMYLNMVEGIVGCCKFCEKLL